MRLTRITIRDFMGYAEADLDLSAVTAAVVVGENGAGKSALLDAFTWATSDHVGRDDLDSQDALIRDGADSARVDVRFTTHDGRDARVVREKQRGRTGSVSLTVDGEVLTRHKQAETFAAIADLMGMPYEGLMAGPVMAQESSGAFMRARPAQRKDLLSTLRGLDRYAALARAASERANALRADAKAAAALADGMRPRLAAEPEHRAAKEAATNTMYAAMEAQSLASARKDAAQAGLAEARARLAALDKAAGEVGFMTSSLARLDQSLTREQQRLAAADAILSAPSAEVAEPAPGPSDEALRAARTAVEAAREAASAGRAKEAEAKGILDRMAAMQEARDRVSGVPCHGQGVYAACQFLTSVPTEVQIAEAKAEHQRVDDARFEYARFVEGLAEKAAAHEALQAERQTALAAKAAAVTARESRAVRLAEADRERADSEQAITGIRTAIADTAAALDRAKAATGDAAAARTEVVGMLADAEMAAAAYTSAQDALRDAERRIAQAEASLTALAALRGEVAGLDAKAEAASEGVRTQSLLAQAFGRDGIPAEILAETIAAIEREANRVLEMLPGGLTLALRTERTLADGRKADTLDVVVTDAGWERQYGLLSVGQRFRVDLALRLGLARAIAGDAVETVWLDEPLAALDATGRAAVMEALTALDGEFGLLVVVSHHEDVNDAFPARIDVTREDGVSRAALA